jgi:hypothetical protein
MWTPSDGIAAGQALERLKAGELTRLRSG